MTYLTRIVAQPVSELAEQCFGYRLPPGHHLRPHLSGSDFPLFLPNPGTGENPWLATRTARSRQTVGLGGDSPSYLTVTVLDPD